MLISCQVQLITMSSDTDTLSLVTTAVSAATGLLELAALGAHIWLGVRARNTYNNSTQAQNTVATVHVLHIDCHKHSLACE